MASIRNIVTSVFLCNALRLSVYVALFAAVVPQNVICGVQHPKSSARSNICTPPLLNYGAAPASHLSFVALSFAS